MSARPIRDAVAETFSGRRLLYAALFGLAYGLLRRYCLSLPAAGSTISYIWLPDGLLLGVLLCTRARHWLPYLLVTFVIGFVDTGRSLGPALLAIGLNIFEPVLVATLLKRLLGSPPRFDSIKSVLSLFLCTIPLMAGTIMLSSGIDWFAQPGRYWDVWRVWFISDTLGMLLLAPLMLAWFGDGRPIALVWRGWRTLEIALAFGGLIVATHVVYTLTQPYAKGITIASLTVPFLIWIALRFHMRGATLALLIVSLQSFWYTANGIGHFARSFDGNEAVVAVQIFLGIGTLITLLPAALITERHRALARSEDWRQRFESVLLASRSLMYEVKPGSRAFNWAGDVRAVLGIDPASIPTAAEWLARVHPDDQHMVENIRARFASGELDSVAREYRLRRDDGAYRYVGITAYVVPDKDAAHGSRPADPFDIRIVGTIRDIDDSKRADEEMRVLEERLKQAQKMEAIGRFADGIAHDFNNILGAILGYGELAKAKAPAGSDLRRYLETIHGAGERGKALVSQILTFSRGKPVDMQPVLIAEIIDEVAAQVRGSLPPGVTIRLSGEFRGAVVLGEATQLHQLAINLCTNAIQAMPGGGEVQLAVRVEANETARDAYLGALKRARYVVIEVRDTGTGMDEATRARIFEPFFTTKPTGSGTGLGLALVQSIALEHGGALDIETAPGRGTRIRVYLPEFAGDWRRPVVPQRDSPRGKGETVMVIDDEPALASLAQELLAELGYEPVAYTSGVEALRAFEGDPRRFDAIVSDEVMPQLTGTQLAARVHQVHADIPILLVSGFGGPGFEIRAGEAGVNRVLRKPYRKRELAEALASVLAVKA